MGEASYWVGDKGPELFVPRGGRVLSNDEVAQRVAAIAAEAQRQFEIRERMSPRSGGRSMHNAEVFYAADGWHWRLRAMNGEIIASGEAFSRRWSAVRAVKKNTDAAKIAVLDRYGDPWKTIRR